MEKLTAICESLNMDKKEFLEKSIEYFSKTGDDPRAPIKDSLIKKLASIENRIIGFIKTQDNDYLKVLLEDTKSAQKRITTQKDEIIESSRLQNKQTQTYIISIANAFEKSNLETRELLSDLFNEMSTDKSELKRLKGKIEEVIGYIEKNATKALVNGGLSLQQAEQIGTHLKALV
jgi:hypothetical protein